MTDLCQQNEYFETRLGAPGECLPCSTLCDDAVQRNNVRDCLSRCPGFNQSTGKTLIEGQNTFHNLQIWLPVTITVFLFSVVIATFLYRRRHRQSRLMTRNNTIPSAVHTLIIREQSDTESASDSSYLALQSLHISNNSHENDQVGTDPINSNADSHPPVTITTVKSIDTGTSSGRQPLVISELFNYPSRYIQARSKSSMSGEEWV